MGTFIGTLGERKRSKSELRGKGIDKENVISSRMNKWETKDKTSMKQKKDLFFCIVDFLRKLAADFSGIP